MLSPAESFALYLEELAIFIIGLLLGIDISA